MKRTQENSPDLPETPVVETGVPAAGLTIRQQQIELVFAQAPAAIGAGFIAALVLTVGLWSVTGHAYLLVWLGVQLLLTGVRMWHVYRFRSAGSKAHNDPQWERMFLLGTLFSGIRFKICPQYHRTALKTPLSRTIER